MITGFQSKHAVVKTSDGRNMESVLPIFFISRSGETIVVPAGALSDGASTPWFIWWFLPPFGKYWLAAFLHDWLYRMSKLPKWKCDLILREAMRSLDVPEDEVELIFWGVRLGGQHAFISDRISRGKNHLKLFGITGLLISGRIIHRRKIFA